MTTGVFFIVCLVLIFLQIFSTIQLLKKHTLNSQITILYQFYDQQALFKVTKICNINAPPPWHFPENSSNLVAKPFPKERNRIVDKVKRKKRKSSKRNIPRWDSRWGRMVSGSVGDLMMGRQALSERPLLFVRAIARNISQIRIVSSPHPRTDHR